MIPKIWKWNGANLKTWSRVVSDSWECQRFDNTQTHLTQSHLFKWQLMIMAETALLLSGPPSPLTGWMSGRLRLGPLCYDRCRIYSHLMQQIMWHVGWLSPGSSWVLRLIGPDCQRVSSSHRLLFCLWDTFLRLRVRNSQQLGLKEFILERKRHGLSLLTNLRYSMCSR